MWSILYYLRNDPEKLRWNMRARFMDENLVDEALKLDIEWRKKKREYEETKHKLNVVSNAIRSAGTEERAKLVAEARRLSEAVKALEQELATLEEEREKLLRRIPNVIHESVPVGPDESFNVVVRSWGRARVPRAFEESFLQETKGKGCEMSYELIDWTPVIHADFLESRGLTNVTKAGEVAGARFYYMMDDLVWLELALIAYALEFLAEKGFRLVVPPLMLQKEA